MKKIINSFQSHYVPAGKTKVFLTATEFDVAIVQQIGTIINVSTNRNSCDYTYAIEPVLSILCGNGNEFEEVVLLNHCHFNDYDTSYIGTVGETVGMDVLRKVVKKSFDSGEVYVSVRTAVENIQKAGLILKIDSDEPFFNQNGYISSPLHKRRNGKRIQELVIDDNVFIKVCLSGKNYDIISQLAFNLSEWQYIDKLSGHTDIRKISVKLAETDKRYQVGIDRMIELAYSYLDRKVSHILFDIRQTIGKNCCELCDIVNQINISPAYSKDYMSADEYIEMCIKQELIHLDGETVTFCKLIEDILDWKLVDA